MEISVFFNPDGRVLSAGSAVDDGFQELESIDVDMETEVDWGRVYVLEGVLVAMPPKPSPIHEFNYTTKQWDDPRTLQDLKDARRAYVNAERLKANQAYFTHEGKQIAADALSRGDIDAINGEINNTGAFPGGWPGAWKCLDNTWLPVVTVESWKALYTSMVNQGTENFGHAQALKAQIEAATSQAEVEVVVW